MYGMSMAIFQWTPWMETERSISQFSYVTKWSLIFWVTREESPSAPGPYRSRWQAGFGPHALICPLLGSAIAGPLLTDVQAGPCMTVPNQGGKWDWKSNPCSASPHLLPQGAFVTSCTKVPSSPRLCPTKKKAPFLQNSSEFSRKIGPIECV